jgi:hypothetical protein
MRPNVSSNVKATTIADRAGARTGGPRDSSTPEPQSQKDINNAKEGRTFLEKHLLLCPAGEPPTHDSLATSLFQIAELKGVSKQAENAIRAVAYLLGVMEETQINGILKEAFDIQITELTADMASLIQDAKDKLTDHFKESEEKLAQLIDKADVQHSHTQQQTTYASIINNPPPHANPRVAAKEGIKARQILLDGIANTKFSHTDVFQLKTELNNILGGLGLKDGKIRSINKLRNDGTLIEMDTDAATTWLSTQENQDKFCEKIGPSVSFRIRVHTLIAFNVPLGLAPEDKKHLQEVCEANSLDPDILLAMKWVKAVHRRTQNQRTAHLFLTFISADAANRAITNGIYICNRRCHVERVKREPTRCLKCQGWNHFAKDCLEENDKCGNCTENHRTNECPSPETRRCVSCKTEDHASWSRECPTFAKKLSEFNERNPENALQYIPTADPWTWTASVKTANQSQPPQASGPSNGKERQPQDKRPRAPPKLYDTYIPQYDNNGKRIPDKDRNGPAPPKELKEYRPLTQDYIDSINKDPRRPINPVQVDPFC